MQTFALNGNLVEGRVRINREHRFLHILHSGFVLEEHTRSVTIDRLGQSIYHQTLVGVGNDIEIACRIEIHTDGIAFAIAPIDSVFLSEGGYIGSVVGYVEDLHKSEFGSQRQETAIGRNSHTALVSRVNLGTDIVIEHAIGGVNECGHCHCRIVAVLTHEEATALVVSKLSATVLHVGAIFQIVEYDSGRSGCPRKCFELTDIVLVDIAVCSTERVVTVVGIEPFVGTRTQNDTSHNGIGDGLRAILQSTRIFVATSLEDRLEISRRFSRIHDIDTGRRECGTCNKDIAIRRNSRFGNSTLIVGSTIVGTPLDIARPSVVALPGNIREIGTEDIDTGSGSTRIGRCTFGNTATQRFSHIDTAEIGTTFRLIDSDTTGCIELEDRVVVAYLDRICHGAGRSRNAKCIEGDIFERIIYLVPAFFHCACIVGIDGFAFPLDGNEDSIGIFVETERDLFFRNSDFAGIDIRHRRRFGFETLTALTFYQEVNIHIVTIDISHSRGIEIDCGSTIISRIFSRDDLCFGETIGNIEEAEADPSSIGVNNRHCHIAMFGITEEIGTCR